MGFRKKQIEGIKWTYFPMKYLSNKLQEFSNEVLKKQIAGIKWTYFPMKYLRNKSQELSGFTFQCST